MSLGFLLGLTPCDSRISHNMHRKFGFITSYRFIHSFLDCKSCPAWCCRIDFLSPWNLWHTSHEYEFVTELWPLDEVALPKGCVPSTTTNDFLSASWYTNLESLICIKDLIGPYSRLPWHQPNADSKATSVTEILHTHARTHRHMHTHLHTHKHTHTHMACIQQTHTHCPAQTRTHCLAQKCCPQHIYTHTHTYHARTITCTHTCARAHTHTHGMPSTHTYTQTLSRTNTYIYTHRHTLPRGSVVFDPTVSVFLKVTVNFSPLPTPLQCPSLLSTAWRPFAPFEDIQGASVCDMLKARIRTLWLLRVGTLGGNSADGTLGGNSANQASARINASSSRNVPRTPCKLQRWSSALIHSSRNALINPIPIHGFRHRGCLRAHPRCCHPFIVCWLIPIKNGWGFHRWNFWVFLPGISNFGAKKEIRKRNLHVAWYESWRGLVGLLGLWATLRHVCVCVCVALFY